MQLRCKNAFGNFKPGDKVEVPDDAAFDQAYFEKVEAATAPKPVTKKGK
jgi:hypothetical protein